MRVALAGEKGGAGKSTLAIGLAVEWCVRGLRVLLVDADPQGSVLTWRKLAARHRSPAAMTPRVEALSGEALYDGIGALAEGHDVVVVDCPGRHDVTQRAALMVADLAILPFRPSVLDTSPLAGSVELVTAARRARRDAGLGELAAAVVVSQRVRGTVLGARAARDVEPLGLPVLATEVHLRVTYAEAYASGLGPTTYDPASAAAAEVRRLTSEVGRLAGLAEPLRRRGR